MPTSLASKPATGADLFDALSDQVRRAHDARTPLRVVGGDSKFFYGRATQGEPLSLAGHTGVIDYEPSELVITVRAGTPVAEVEALLAANDQMLAFEPPILGPGSSIGGMVAAGLSGPRRPFAGAVRDFVLGVTILDGRGRRLRFGGTVFKNVAGFDAFRLMAGSLGCLGVILDVSIRVTPRPRAELALTFEMDWPAAQARLAALMRRPLPLSAAAHERGRLHLRLSGPEAAVAVAHAELGGEADALGFWESVRHMTHPAQTVDGKLWRVSVPQQARMNLDGDWFIDWAGAQRWLVTDRPDESVRAAAATADGHATIFHDKAHAPAPFAPLPPPLLALHQRLKAAFDPAGILNPGRMYAEL
jgi:glycolate oxidase FAD binding subunit